MSSKMTVFNRTSASETEELASLKVPHAAILCVLLIIAMLGMVVLATIDAASDRHASLAVLTTFAVNALIGLVFMVKAILERAFSLTQMHWIFFITFFVIAPLSQYLWDFFCWDYVLSDNDYLITNLMLSTWGVLFAVFGSLRIKERVRAVSYKGFSRNFYSSVEEVSNTAAIVMLVIATICTALIINQAGFANLFSRNTYSNGLNQTSGLLFDTVIRSAPVFALAVLIARYKQSRRGFALCAACLSLTLIADFPAGMARYNAAAIYGGILLLAFTPLMERKGLFPALFLVAFLIVYPGINVFRVNEFDIGLLTTALWNAFMNLPQGFCTEDYDAYSMLARSMHYVFTYGPSMGFQFLTALLFFIPRAIWPSKGIGSGATIAIGQGQPFTNISCPLPGEGIINFGIFGLVIFAIALAFICRELDIWFANNRGGFRLFYPFACIMLFFVMRGDLLSGFAYLVGFAATFVMIWIIVKALSHDAALQGTCDSASVVTFQAQYGQKPPLASLSDTTGEAIDGR